MTNHNDALLNDLRARQMKFAEDLAARRSDANKENRINEAKAMAHRFPVKMKDSTVRLKIRSKFGKAYRIDKGCHNNKREIGE